MSRFGELTPSEEREMWGPPDTYICPECGATCDACQGKCCSDDPRAERLREREDDREREQQELAEEDEADGADVMRPTGRPRYKVCPVCEGEGKYVNPAIDSQGLSQEDFDEDPDFRESYFAGHYDVPCKCCDGKRVVTEEEERVYWDRVSDHHTRMAESGIFGGYDERL